MKFPKSIKRNWYEFRRGCRIWFRPSRMLVLFFLIQLLAFVLLACWQKRTAAPHEFGGLLWPHLAMQQWVVLAGVEAAIMGWVVTSYMTLRNSIKQHTINTLLQSRLSATYMQHAVCINKKFFPPNELTYDHVPPDFFTAEENVETVQSVAYILNYFEFLSAAVRYGDLDETLLRSALGGILIRFYERMMLFIKFQRGDDGRVVKNPRQLEHYTWLFKRWKKKKGYEDWLWDQATEDRRE